MSTLLPPGGLASGEDVLNGGPERLVALLDAYLDEHGIRDTSNSVPFTMYVQLTVPLSKVVLFERWVQNLVVAQSQTRVGYQGTLLYRPDEALLEPVGATAAQVFVLDFRYTGAENLRAWIRSRTCASRLAKAMRRQLWLDGSVEATVTHGRVATLDNVWADAQVGALTEPVLAKWKLVLFSSAASWLVALALAWPQVPPASHLRSFRLPMPKTLGKHIACCRPLGLWPATFQQLPSGFHVTMLYHAIIVIVLFCHCPVRQSCHNAFAALCRSSHPQTTCLPFMKSYQP